MTHIMAEARGREQYFLSEHVSYIMSQADFQRGKGISWFDTDGNEFILEIGRSENMTDLQMNAGNPKRQDGDPVLLLQVVDGIRKVVYRPSTNAEVQEMLEDAMEANQDIWRVAKEAEASARGGDKMADFTVFWSLHENT